MQYRALVATTSAAVSLLLGVACDKPVETVEETPPPTPVQAGATVQGNVDLQAVVDVVASGEVESAAELETKLEADAIAHVDLDVDGKRDELRIVEKRVDTKTVFEIRAVPSSKAEIDIELAPPVATLEFEARADAGVAVARASYSASFAASAHLDASATVEHTFTGVSVEASGRMAVEASANVFVGWAFRVGRPVYIAEVFVVHVHEAPEPDPCWPPGHCKHGFWKATGDAPPGHMKKRGDVALAGGHGKADHRGGFGSGASSKGHGKVDVGGKSGGGGGSKAHHSGGGSKGPSKSASKGSGGSGGKAGGGKGGGGKKGK